MKHKHWNHFLSLCHKAHNLDELSRLLNFFLTIEEKESIVDRFLIIEALLKGNKTQREISKDLSVSIAKITRGSNALKAADQKLLEFLRKNTDQ